jgi:hypothetical protein
MLRSTGLDGRDLGSEGGRCCGEVRSREEG